MTNEEAINRLGLDIDMVQFDPITGGDRYLSNDERTLIEAQIMGIEALRAQKVGHWIKTPKAVMGEGYMWYCDKCEHQVYQDSSRDYPSENYCPNCGAKNRKMEGQE